MNLNDAYKMIKESDKPYYCYSMDRGIKSPFYIGIGKGRRIREHSYELTAFDKGTHPSPERCNTYKLNIMRKLRDSGEEVDYQIMSFHDTWEEACEAEIELIAFIGRKVNGGLLVNMTDGGEGAVGRPASEKAKEAARVANSKPKSRESIEKMLETKRAIGFVKSFLGKTHTEEWRKAQSERMSGENHPGYGKRGELCHNFGKNHSDETKKKISDKLTGRTIPEDIRKRTSETMLGVPKTEETKIRMKAAQALVAAEKAVSTCASWQNLETREKREQGIRQAFTDRSNDPVKSALVVCNKIVSRQEKPLESLQDYLERLLKGHKATQSKSLALKLEEAGYRNTFINTIQEFIKTLYMEHINA